MCVSDKEKEKKDENVEAIDRVSTEDSHKEVRLKRIQDRLLGETDPGNEAELSASFSINRLKRFEVKKDYRGKLNSPSPSNQLQHQHDDGNNQQDVNQAADGLAGKSKT